MLIFFSIGCSDDLGSVVIVAMQKLKYLHNNVLLADLVINRHVFSGEKTS